MKAWLKNCTALYSQKCLHFELLELFCIFRSFLLRTSQSSHESLQVLLPKMLLPFKITFSPTWNDAESMFTLAGMGDMCPLGTEYSQNLFPLFSHEVHANCMISEYLLSSIVSMRTQNIHTLYHLCGCCQLMVLLDLRALSFSPVFE